MIRREIAGGSGITQPEDARELQALAREAGLWGIDCPEEHGGLNLDPISQAIVFEELGKSFIKFLLPGSVPNVLYLVNDEQKKEYLLPTLRGERQSCFALSEPGVGSDARNLRTTAVKNGGDWVINGEKTWITWGMDADFALVFARTRDEAGVDGVTAFLVDRSCGWTATPVRNMGHGDTSSLYFDNVRVSDRNRVGEINKGFSLAMRFVYRNRGWMLGARNVGAAQRLLGMALDHAENRTTFGKKLADRENIQFMITESEVELRASKLMVWHCAWQGANEIDYRYAACAAKLYTARMVNNVVDRVMQIHGAMGFAKETGIERWYRDLRVQRIFEGSDEMQLTRMFSDLRESRMVPGQLH